MSGWRQVRKLLCVRLDNMGDVIMSGPAIAALKESFQCHVTLLTSSTAKSISPMIPGIDETIVYDVPWVKNNQVNPAAESLYHMANILRAKKFDGAVIFTVFSQTALPAAMLTWMADIPLRAAYCRENPYSLLTDWLPDPEPYRLIQHQVLRDLALVKTLGATVHDDRLQLRLPHQAWTSAQDKLQDAGVDLEKPWIILHPGVSEERRKYPTALWRETAQKLVDELDVQIVVTGSEPERDLAEEIAIPGPTFFSCAGRLTLEEFIISIYYAPLVISVNTATIHIAAATQTTVIVLYAMTNPQHTPWKGKGYVLPFSIDEAAKSKNEVLKFVDQTQPHYRMPSPDEIVTHAMKILRDGELPSIPVLATEDSETVRTQSAT